MRIGSTDYAVLEVITINGLTVPVLDIPMMSDKRRKQYIPADVLEKAKEIQMTDRQREMWNLYVVGIGISSIAKRFGRSYGTVWNTVSRIFWRIQGKHCQYSNDCFSCPLPDCVISQQQASVTNLLPTDKYISLWRK